MLKEFKAFALTGSLVDIAIGVVMGAAFGTVTTAFINGLFMPVVGLIFQVGDLSEWKLVLAQAETDAAGKVVTPESALMMGGFAAAVINFIIIAFVMFLIIKGINSMKKKEADAPAAPAGPSAQEVLLMEIRDSLRK